MGDSPGLPDWGSAMDLWCRTCVDLGFWIFFWGVFFLVWVWTWDLGSRVFWKFGSWSLDAESWILMDLDGFLAKLLKCRLRPHAKIPHSSTSLQTRQALLRRCCSCRHQERVKCSFSCPEPTIWLSFGVVVLLATGHSFRPFLISLQPRTWSKTELYGRGRNHAAWFQVWVSGGARWAEGPLNGAAKGDSLCQLQNSVRRWPPETRWSAQPGLCWP